MKKIILIILLFSFSSIFSQTQEEYNYLTKGLKIQEESGLDMKKGYSLQSIPSNNLIKEYKIRFRYLVNENSKKVAISVFIHELKSQNKMYLAIPLENDIENNKRLSRYYEIIYGFSKDLLAAYNLALTSTLIYSAKE